MSKSMEFTVTDLSALEILDSRGNPTLRVNVTFRFGCHGSCRCPFGCLDGES
jgi:enolase